MSNGEIVYGSPEANTAELRNLGLTAHEAFRTFVAQPPEEFHTTLTAILASFQTEINSRGPSMHRDSPSRKHHLARELDYLAGTVIWRSNDDDRPVVTFSDPVHRDTIMSAYWHTDWSDDVEVPVVSLVHKPLSDPRSEPVKPNIEMHVYPSGFHGSIYLPDIPQARILPPEEPVFGFRYRLAEAGSPETGLDTLEVAGLITPDSPAIVADAFEQIAGQFDVAMGQMGHTLGRMIPSLDNQKYLRNPYSLPVYESVGNS